MTALIQATPTNTRQTIESDAERAKFLRRVVREDNWTMTARASEDWQIVFTRTIKAQNPGDADIDVVVRLKDKITLVGRWGNQQSFHDSDVVCVPKPDRCWLNYGAVATAARLLLEKNSHFLICGSSGSTSSSKHGLAFVSLQALIGTDHVTFGHQSVYVHGRMVCCGSVE